MKFRVWNPNTDGPEETDVPTIAETPEEAARVVASNLDTRGLLFPDDLDGDRAELRVASWDDPSFKVIFTLEATLRWERSIDYRQRTS